MCCALVWVMQRLRQYTLYHTIRLLSKADPLKYLLDSPSSMWNIAKWRCQLTKYDIEYVSRTSVKGQAIADHLAEFPIEDNTPIDPNFPDEGILQVDDEGEKPKWKMYFDGAVNSTGSGIGTVLISPDGRYYPIAAKIDFPCTNNVAEYEACILGLQAAIDFKVKELEVFGDSMLTIFQTLGQWKTKDAKLVPYHEYLERLTENFEDISFTYTPRMNNQFADALATLASMVSITKENLIEPLEIEITKGPAHCNAIEASEAKPWYEDIKNFLRTGQCLPFADRRDRKTLRRLAIHYFLSGEMLYRRSFDSTLLRCIDEHESGCLMEEVHGGNCGPHMNGLMLVKKIMRLGYYWFTMETDCVKHVRHCHRCQVYADQIKAPPNELRPMTAPWPFSMWGMDVIGPINPKASNGHMFILVAIDYFTKWIDAITLASVTAKAVARFLRRDVIARILAETELEEAEWAKQRYEQLNFIDEKRLKALFHGQCYQQRMARAFNARVRHREFNPGGLVLRKVLHVTLDSRGKFSYKYDGPIVVKETFSRGAVILSDMDGTENALPVRSGTLGGIFSPTDARLAHVAGRNPKPSEGPKKKKCSTPAQTAMNDASHGTNMTSVPRRTIRLCRNFTAFHGLRPSKFTAFHGIRPSDLLLSTGFGLVRALLHILPKYPTRRGELLRRVTTRRSSGPKRDAPRDLWLPPLIEHATKEGQAVSTPFWSTGSDRGLSAKARDAVHVSGTRKRAYKHPGTTGVGEQTSDDPSELDLASRGTFQWPRTPPGEPSGHVHDKQRSQRSPNASIHSKNTEKALITSPQVFPGQRSSVGDDEPTIPPQAKSSAKPSHQATAQPQATAQTHGSDLTAPSHGSTPRAGGSIPPSSPHHKFKFSSYIYHFLSHPSTPINLPLTNPTLITLDIFGSPCLGALTVINFP
ncbi:hypothetical protein CRG98_006432 [Punica granatum]|uniref:RNase H type-1 domain-containing protein n=1 Tax=Punica granatum TaxID=22663 RepID=A0A2I0KZ98_PUNGR|nr:hypothetical protein CRG98_006432 [Punica granatum]